MFISTYDLELCASSFQRMVSKGFIVSLSFHDAFHATRP